MNIRPIKTEQEYEQALHLIDGLMDAEPGTPEGDQLDVLATLVVAFEANHFPISDPDPVEFLKQVMEFRGLKQTDLATVLGSRPRASEILNRKRSLSLDQIRLISREWQVSPEALIAEYPLQRESA